MSDQRKSLLVFVTVLVLLAAGSYLYLNWSTSNQMQYETIGAIGSGSPNLVEPQIDQNENNQEEADEEDDSSFFAEYRLERERTRSQRIDILNMVINNPNTAPEVRLDAQKELEQIAEKTETEMVVENLLTAKGFEDALLFIHDGSVDVIVKTTDGLTQAEAIQIRDIVARSLNIPMADVVIIEK